MGIGELFEGGGRGGVGLSLDERMGGFRRSGEEERSVEEGCGLGGGWVVGEIQRYGSEEKRRHGVSEPVVCTCKEGRTGTGGEWWRECRCSGAHYTRFKQSRI